MPDFLQVVFSLKTNLKRSENERFGLVFAKALIYKTQNWVSAFGHWTLLCPPQMFIIFIYENMIIHDCDASEVLCPVSRVLYT